MSCVYAEWRDASSRWRSEFLLLVLRVRASELALNPKPEALNPKPVGPV